MSITSGNVPLISSRLQSKQINRLTNTPPTEAHSRYDINEKAKNPSTKNFQRKTQIRDAHGCEELSVKVFHLNIQCLSNKSDELAGWLSQEDFDVLALSEHWLTNEQIKTVSLPNFVLISFFCRTKSCHGGVAIYVKDTLKHHFTQVNIDNYSIEIAAEFCAVENKATKTIIIALYRSCLSEFEIFHGKLETLLIHLTGIYKTIVILGDFNVDFLGSSVQLEELICLTSSFNLKPTIHDFTRVTHISQTCIDNVLTNITDDSVITGVIDPCISDHKGQIFQFKLLSNVITKPIFKRIITPKGLENIETLISTFDWTEFYNNSDPNSLAAYLTAQLRNTIEHNMPTKRISLSMHPPVKWFNNELKDMRNTLQAIKLISEHNGDENSLNAYKQFRTQYRNRVKEVKTSCYDNYILHSSNKIRDTWKLINFESNRVRNRSEPPIEPDEFNNFFSTVAEDIIKSLPELDREISITNLPTPTGSFFLHAVTKDEVITAINNLKNSKADDFYGLNSLIVKHLRKHLVAPLLYIFNRCIDCNLYPDVFKISKVIPIFKKGNDEDMNNYRPISIIPILGKIFEVILKPRITKFVEGNKLLNPRQFGFRGGMSTIDAVTTLVADIVSGFEKGHNTTLTLCDLSKAFDCVSLDRLLHKMDAHFGFRGLTLDFFRSYLTGRAQCVKLMNQQSEVKSIQMGVPQGSVLGPVLFSMYINDIYYYLLPEKCVLYADDTSLISQGKSYDETKHNTEMLEFKASQWFLHNKLLLNEEKTNKITITSNPVSSRGESVNLLGITIDDNLRWSHHINILSRKLSTSIFQLRKLSTILSKVALRSAYFAFFNSYISYGITLWGNSPTAIRVFIMQKKAVRILANIGFRDHCKPYFISLKILTLPSLYVQQCLIAIHKNKSSYTLNSDIHDYNTRNSHLLHTPRFRLHRSAMNSISVQLYNRLSVTTRLLSMNNFKNAIKNFLIQRAFYSIEEYMTTPDVV